MLSSVSTTEFSPGIFAIDAPCGPDFDVRALLVLGTESGLLLDTLARPRDLDPVADLLNDRSPIIVNTHADWDHWFGNDAFPAAPVLAHRLTRERQRRNGRRALANLIRRDADFFAGVGLRPATITFESRLDIELGSITVELHHLPGHTADSLVAFIPQRKLLFAADAAEVPIPVVGQADVSDWADELERWSKIALVVVPSHGAIGGPELLRRNASYLRGLKDGRLEADPDWTDFYRRTHRANLKRVREG